MTREEAIEYWELLSSEIDDLLPDTYGACKKALKKQREAVEFTIAALRGQREDKKMDWISVKDRLPEPLGEPSKVKHGCDFAKKMGFSSCDKCPIDCDIRQMPKEDA